ncbi:DUF397 domain-containing protein [Streptomyces sp. LX-29]|uniref:DUF397 domain-containing protein n=1 Tax=Streptomyces sp. LX-29 TaxID=2900152 RepID=UPI00240D6BD1|nr:DUF397 domain-containing protein [Streptomyces sp. LX-29]WFB08957.1 DUF397 domain-containing protein [Streptomyces sp. LX-29]
MSVELAWFKSSHSGGGQDCIEVATEPAAVHIRDSKNRTGPTLTVSPAQWAAFVAYARDARHRG